QQSGYESAAKTPILAAKATIFAFSSFITSYYTYNITLLAVNCLKNHCCISDSAPYHKRKRLETNQHKPLSTKRFG
ncbi:MAG: hypothetical protein ACYTX0_62685, partial [Nostoc sp.]